MPLTNEIAEAKSTDKSALAYQKWQNKGKTMRYSPPERPADLNDPGFVFMSERDRADWQREHGVCRNCGGPNEARKHLLPSAYRRFMSGKKIYFNKDYWKPVCRKCLGEKKEAALARELMRAHTAKLPARQKCEPGYHYCSKCQLNKPFASFYVRKRGAGLASICKECKIEMVKTYQGTRETSVKRIPIGRKGEYLGYTVLQHADGEIVRRSYANGYSDTYPDGSETWTKREASS